MALLYSGPEMTELLLSAGADPNRLDSAGRPIWWTVLSSFKDDSMVTLRSLLNHGADLKLRHQEGNGVGWAAHYKNWDAVLLLIERGAEWKNEKQFGEPVAQMVANDYRPRGDGRIPPEALQEIMKMFQPDVPDAASTSRQ
ncbi:MAG: hypothetical protein ABIZ80_26205 [Bryobacteraceae bacterium]